VSGFETFAIVDWSAGKRANRPKADAIWIGLTRNGEDLDPPIFCRNRQEAETCLVELIETEAKAGRRLLLGFDFPFGYPQGVARAITGSDDPFALWGWLAERIEDAEDGSNNRFDVAEEMNDCFEGPGPFWGKSERNRWSGVPFNKANIVYEAVAEKRACDVVANAASSCFQLYYNPTVGSQVLMGLPVLHRLRAAFAPALAVWPLEVHDAAQTVLVEIWPGLIEPAVKQALAGRDRDRFKDAVQVRLLARALANTAHETLVHWLADLPVQAREEAWILGAGHSEALCQAAAAPGPQTRTSPAALA